ISDFSHNALFSRLGYNAIYVKMAIQPHEIGSFLYYAKQLGFQGLSVTMPLKEQLLPYLDSIDPSAQEIGAINTLFFTDNHIHGYNTDGIGALNALEKCCPVNGKHLVLIGAGGAARAIAYEAIRRGAKVTIVNRNATKALELAKELNCMGMGLNQMASLSKQGYNVLINCTPHPLAIPQNEILPNCIAMDIVTKPKESAFLKAAKAQGCRIIYGYNMFIEQALGQFQLWFKDSFDLQNNRMLLERFVLNLFSNQTKNSS
ncbi:MAG: shikimate dehydrogenase, partial [Parachlamydiaceae bacterium]